MLIQFIIREQMHSELVDYSRYVFTVVCAFCVRCAADKTTNAIGF